MIQRDTPVEELVEDVPDVVAYLIGKGIQPIACGQPIWGTLEEAARSSGYADDAIDELVAEIRALSAAHHGSGRTTP